MDITVKNSTIVAVVACVLGRKKTLDRHDQDGIQPATRKNPHATDVGFGQDIIHN